MFSQNIEEIFSFENFMFFYNSISNSERKIKNRLNLFNLYSEILNELKDKKYKPQGFTCFYKSHPKEREILTPKFKDQIVQHFLVFLINELFENDLSNNSFANRKNMGTRKAVKKVQEYCLKYPKGYYLKCDIKNYFPSINKDILKELLFLKIEKSNFSKEKKELIYFLINQTLPYDFKKITHIIKNKDISNLIPPHKSLFNAKYNKGLPIGSFISQFYSLIYLNVLDEFIEKHLNIKHYARFVDDFVIIEETKDNFDKYLIEINDFLKTTLDCELNQTKTKINFTKNGIDFVGYIIKPYNLLCRKRNINIFKEKLKIFNFLISDSTIQHKIKTNHLNTKTKLLLEERILTNKKIQITPYILKTFLETINSYYNYMNFSNSYNLRVDLYNNHFNLLQNYFYPVNSFKKIKIKPINYFFKKY